VNNEDLSVEFKDLQAELDRMGIVTVLAGGLRLHELIDIELVPAVRFDPQNLQPSTLARIGRHTDDVDFIVPADSKREAAKRLHDLDFKPDRRLDFRYRRDDVVVDLLSTASTDPPLSQVLALIEERVRLDPGPAPHLATPAEMVVLKLIAWDDRYADKDLIDLARLSLWDVDGRGILEALPPLLRRLSPMARRSCGRTAEAFATADGAGPRAYWQAFLRQVVVTDAEALEDRLRSLVSGAGRRLLRDV
jgi:hypothetical protein